jgi:hypothetical protein
VQLTLATFPIVASNFRHQLLSADLLEERQVVVHDAPQHIVRDVLVIVAKSIPNPCAFRPWG